jgi:hypothetical protein
MCKVCQENYYGWDKKTPAEKAAVPRTGVPKVGVLRAKLFLKSGNRKLGGIACSVSSRDTCPESCAFYGAGCYAEYGRQALHWRRVGETGDSWKKFCADVARLPAGSLWRHNVAGDLPGVGERIDGHKLLQLVEANKGRHGFTFTHRKTRVGTEGWNGDAILFANNHGFTVNLSANDLTHADKLASLGIAPVAVVVPSDAPDKMRTPAGRHVIVCPAQTAAERTCADCKLCAKPQRKVIIAFRAHGQSAALVELRVRNKTVVSP